MPTPLYTEIYKTITAIPFGQVASYSQVARAVGMPRGARIVGWALGALPELQQIPWWRVVNAKRELSIRNPKVGPLDQKEFLEQEGRVISERDGLYRVDGDDWWELEVVPPGRER